MMTTVLKQQKLIGLEQQHNIDIIAPWRTQDRDRARDKTNLWRGYQNVPELSKNQLIQSIEREASNRTQR